MTLQSPLPVLRIFDEALALQYYVGWLGFHIDWTHRADPAAPVYIQISRGGTVLHLSSHWGDCSPGAKVLIPTDDVDGLLAELNSYPISHYHPAVEEQSWGRTMTLLDPFANRLVFLQRPAGKNS